ncbi:MAG: hypothetical protein Q4D93_02910 [Porphyromonas sp.]|nr:hypothetical protein [Porphyromonas sp.]
MTHKDLSNLLAHPDRLGADDLMELLELSEQYPYAASLHFLILIALHKEGDLRFSAELHRRVLYLPSPSRLHQLLVEHPSALLESVDGKHEEIAETTSDIISNFLESYPDEPVDIDQMLSTAPSQGLIEGIADDNTQSYNVSELIDNFLNKGEAAEKIPVEDQPKTSTATEADSFDTEELFTETLARIYIRQGKYERARHILRQINLEYPQKSGYFAEQIGFLDKLIDNSKHEF